MCSTQIITFCEDISHECISCCTKIQRWGSMGLGKYISVLLCAYFKMRWNKHYLSTAFLLVVMVTMKDHAQSSLCNISISVGSTTEMLLEYIIIYSNIYFMVHVALSYPLVCKYLRNILHFI